MRYKIHPYAFIQDPTKDELLGETDSMQEARAMCQPGERCIYDSKTGIIVYSLRYQVAPQTPIPLASGLQIRSYQR